MIIMNLKWFDDIVKDIIVFMKCCYGNLLCFIGSNGVFRCWFLCYNDDRGF